VLSSFFSLPIPKAVTTTSLIMITSSFITICKGEAVASRFSGTNPTKEKRMVLPNGAFNEKLPFASVTVPMVLPSSWTVTPDIGKPFSSVTVPDTVT